MPVDVTFDEITRNEIFFEGWIDDTLWVDEDCFDAGGFPRCKIEGKVHIMFSFFGKALSLTFASFSFHIVFFKLDHIFYSSDLILFQIKTVMIG